MPSKWLAVTYNSNLTCNDALRVAAAGMDEYLKATGLGNEPGCLLFPAALGKIGKLSRRPLVRTDAAPVFYHFRVFPFTFMNWWFDDPGQPPQAIRTGKVLFRQS
jgi:hypothetical protein